MPASPDRPATGDDQAGERRLVRGADAVVGFLDAAGLEGPGLDQAIVDALAGLADDAVLAVHARAAAEPAIRRLGASHGFDLVMVIPRPHVSDATFALVARPRRR